MPRTTRMVGRRRVRPGKRHRDQLRKPVHHKIQVFLYDFFILFTTHARGSEDRGGRAYHEGDYTEHEHAEAKPEGSQEHELVPGPGEEGGALLVGQGDLDGGIFVAGITAGGLTGQVAAV